MISNKEELKKAFGRRIGWDLFDNFQGLVQDFMIIFTNKFFIRLDPNPVSPIGKVNEVSNQANYPSGFSFGLEPELKLLNDNVTMTVVGEVPRIVHEELNADAQQNIRGLFTPVNKSVHRSKTEVEQEINERSLTVNILHSSLAALTFEDGKRDRIIGLGIDPQSNRPCALYIRLLHHVTTEIPQPIKVAAILNHLSQRKVLEPKFIEALGMTDEVSKIKEILDSIK